MLPLPAYKLVRLANGVHSVHSLAHQETFHPVIGPVAEAEALYVRQLDLVPRVTAAPHEFVLWDVGLGAAANVLTALRATKQTHAKMRIVSFDHSVEPLQFALSEAAALGYFSSYEQPVEQLLSNGQTTFRDGAREVEWTLHLADFPALLNTEDAARFPKPHGILFDAFSPAKNPAMWTQPLFTRLYQLLDPMRPCALPTYSRSTLLRVTLLMAGFFVGAGHATGEKEETTIAANNRDLIKEPLGAAWLKRARQSTSAEPLTEPRYRQAPLTAATWELLQAHPQFAPRA